MVSFVSLTGNNYVTSGNFGWRISFKRTTEFYSIFNSSIQMEFNDSIVELEIYSNVNKLADALLKEYGVD